MSSFVGFASFNKNLSKDLHIVKDMNLKIQKEIINEEDYYIDNHIALGYSNKKQSLSIRHNDRIYSIVLNGHIYNKKEIKEELQELGYEFESCLDTELLLKAFIHWGTEMLKKINGVFSFVIWDNKSKDIFLARDHFGIKPLYYAIVDNILILGTEIKGILSYPKIEVCIDKQSIYELLGLRTSTYARKYCV